MIDITPAKYKCGNQSPMCPKIELDITPDKYKCMIGNCDKIELDGVELVLTGKCVEVNIRDNKVEATIRLPFAMVKEALDSLK